VSKRPRTAAKLVARPGQLVGQPIRRVEDPKFLTGNASYVDDLNLPGMLHACFVRSPHAHAKILSIDPSEALRLPGVVAVLTGTDIEGKVRPLIEPAGETGEEGWGANSTGVTWRALAVGTVNYAGEAVAVVIAEDRYVAEDGAEAVSVEYDSLPVVVDAEAALAPGSPKVHEYLEGNQSSHHAIHAGDVEKAFKRADQVVKVRLLNQRLSPAPLEPRGIMARFDRGTGVLTAHVSTQDPHGVRDELADNLSLAREKVRVIGQDTGGGFGGKSGIYPEDPVVCHAAMLLNRPVKWVETRRENLLTMKHGRGQVQYVELAMSRQGKILGLKVRLVADGGAYGGEGGLARLTLMMAPGVYDIANYQGEAFVAMTNKVPMGAYRGAGRPEASYLIERTINVACSRMKLDPVKVRRLNYIPKEKFPYHTAGGTVYDSGDYQSNLAKALKVSGHEELLRQQAAARAKGRLVGIGLATWIEISGAGPGWPQSAAVTVTEEGRVLVNLGGHVHGQGHETTHAQVVADELGLSLGEVTVVDGDTALLPWSSLTAGSRSAAMSGSAAVMCARKIRDKMAAIAAPKLGARSPNKITFSKGMIFREDQPSKKLKFAEVANMAYGTAGIPRGMEPTLYAYSVYSPKSATFPFGTHLAMVEVDKETGFVKVLKYFAVDDASKLINPLIVEGQVHGGVVQGIGQALIERVVYDGDGQPLTSTFADYLLPSAEMFPEIVWDRTETPTSANLMGVKGIGEAGTIAATPTIINAVEDALSGYGALVERMPATPDYVQSLMKGAS
jgi:carbon-monoxide dehydrogenase large subunit